MNQNVLAVSCVGEGREERALRKRASCVFYHKEK